MFLVFKAKFKVFGLGCAIINTRENNVNEGARKLIRAKIGFSRTQGAQKLVCAKMSTNKVAKSDFVANRPHEYSIWPLLAL